MSYTLAGLPTSYRDFGLDKIDKIEEDKSLFCSKNRRCSTHRSNSLMITHAFSSLCLEMETLPLVHYTVMSLSFTSGTVRKL